MSVPAGWDPIARDEWGAALSAGERCDRELCRHEWFAHDHAYAEYGTAEFGRCLMRDADGGRCRCMAFYPRRIGRPPEVVPPPLTVPLPPLPPLLPPRHVPIVPGRHARPDPPTVPTTVPIPEQQPTRPLIPTQRDGTGR